MKLYGISYSLRENEDSDFVYNRKYQIPAENEYDALVRLGQLNNEDRVIKVMSVEKVSGY
jgi:hypothetical protein